ncbi:MAG: hypothetical protein US10_C0030G0003 [Candidatus Moranbacteria bacterium GW2011_GWD2_36_198]|nr:MAG: hypothetical protein US10_C0030G0003 [Candidatus Moranbacteria bacterium GW2011_GWD2_36_198]
MENENKVEDKILEASETKVDLSAGEAGKKVSFVEKMKKRCCGNGPCKINCKNKGIIAAVVILLLLIAGSYGYKQYREKIDLGPEAVKTKVEKFLSENVPATAK